MPVGLRDYHDLRVRVRLRVGDCQSTRAAGGQTCQQLPGARQRRPASAPGAPRPAGTGPGRYFVLNDSDISQYNLSAFLFIVHNVVHSTCYIQKEVVYGSGLSRTQVLRVVLCALTSFLWHFHEIMRLHRTHDDCLRPSELIISESIRKVRLFRR